MRLIACFTFWRTAASGPGGRASARAPSSRTRRRTGAPAWTASPSAPVIRPRPSSSPPPARAGHFFTENTEPTRTEPNCRFFGLFGSVSVFIFVRFGGRLRLRFLGSTEPNQPNNRFGGAQSKQLRCASEQPARCVRERAGQRPPKRASERSTGVTWASSGSG